MNLSKYPDKNPLADATPSYRGYRLQALYTLFRVLSARETKDAIFQPEGREDLAIFSGNHKLVEIIQVKAHKKELTLSSFEPEKPASFFYRVACITYEQLIEWAGRLEKARDFAIERYLYWVADLVEYAILRVE
ncbi:MAG: hypothetical protein CV087_20985 [Candidatus Brocadia sp. WS118]|nr:MAG: hypothetical protein CV087_20985 [Candidatus Brocadia sp. WS118]